MSPVQPELPWEARPARTLAGAVIAVVDTETTGVDPLQDRVIELAVGLFEIGRAEPLERVETLINPGCPIPPEAGAVNGITDAMVAGCGSFAESAGAAFELLARADLVAGYNWPYDRAMLVAELCRCGWHGGGRRRFPPHELDVLTLFRHFRKYNRGKRLCDAAACFAVPESNAHRALGDVLTTWGVLRAMIEEAPALADEEMADLCARCAELARAQHAELNAYYARIGRHPRTLHPTAEDIAAHFAGGR